MRCPLVCLSTSVNQSGADGEESWGVSEQKQDNAKIPTVKERMRDSPRSPSPRSPSPRSPTTYGKTNEDKDIDDAPPLDGADKLDDSHLHRSTKQRHFELENAQNSPRKKKNKKKLRF